MKRANILSYGRGRYAWLALGLTAACIATYLTQEASAPPSGSTWQGYVLGSVAALLIVWLSMLGIRKRKYYSASKNQAWVSAHVYLGLALLAIATLHSAGQLGWNIHSATYGLMVLVVASGIAGIWMYLVLPRNAAENRKGMNRSDMFEELSRLNAHCIEYSAKCTPESELAIKSSISGTVVGGSLWDQLLAVDRSTFLAPSMNSGEAVARNVSNKGQSAVLQYTAACAPRASSGSEADALQELVSIIARRQELLDRIRREIRYQGWLKIWLFLHIPLTVALLAALVAHITVVFLYW